MQQLLIIHGQEEEEEQLHDKPFFYSRLSLDLSFDLFVSRDLVLCGNNNNSREDDDGIVSVCHKLTFDIQVHWTVVTLWLTDGALVLRWAFQFNLLPCLVVLAALAFCSSSGSGLRRGGPLMSIKRGGWIILFGKRNKKRYYRRRRIKEQRAATRYKKTRHDPGQEIWREARDETVIVRFQSGG